MRLLLISFVILIFGLIGFLNPLRDIAQKFMVPIQFGMRRSAVNLKDSARLFYNLDQLRKENITLLEQNQELKSLVIDLKKIQHENELLTKQLKVQGTQPFFGKKLIAASAMGNATDRTNTSIILDKGTKDGITQGANVVSQTFLVGRVTKTARQTSLVELITAPNFSATVKDLETQAEGVANGNLGTSVIVSKILAGEKVETGDTFITTGKDGYYLPWLAVGNVLQVTQESAQPIKNALLKTPVSFNSLSKVFVLVEE